MISLEKVCFDNEGRKILDHISVSILPGAIVRISGQNGSGKTTFLRILAGILQPNSGNVEIDSKVAYIGHNIGVKDDLTVLEHLIFWAELAGGNETLIPAAIKYLKMEDIVEDSCYTLSAGNRKKLAMSRLIINEAPIWILDEIDASLDTQNIELLKGLIDTKTQNGGIVVFSSHNDTIPSSFSIEVGRS